MACKPVAVTANVAKFLEANQLRQAFLMVNLDAAETIYISDDSGQVLIPIAPNGNIRVCRSDGFNAEATWYCYGSGACNGAVLEGFAMPAVAVHGRDC